MKRSALSFRTNRKGWGRRFPPFSVSPSSAGPVFPWRPLSEKGNDLLPSSPRARRGSDRQRRGRGDRQRLVRPRRLGRRGGPGHASCSIQGPAKQRPRGTPAAMLALLVGMTLLLTAADHWTTYLCLRLAGLRLGGHRGQPDRRAGCSAPSAWSRVCSSDSAVSALAIAFLLTTATGSAARSQALASSASSSSGPGGRS